MRPSLYPCEQARQWQPSRDVAALAGVSFTTVSHVVNNSRPVSAALRAKVEAAIGQLHYVPSGVARSLKVRATSTIGLLVPNNSNPYFAELARGIEDHCERNGYCVFLCNSDDDPDKQRKYLRVLLEKRIDGMIVTSAGGDAVLSRGLAAARVPVVIVDRGVKNVLVDLVQIDHEAGAYMATRHLLELGHRTIGCISGPTAMPVSVMRVRGHHRALAEAGIDQGSQGLIESDFSNQGGYEAALRLFDTLRPSAIFAGNDMMGIGVLRGRR